MPFDVEKAMAAGHSKQEIADYLSRSEGFDSAKARAAGHTDDEIVSYLAGSTSAPVAMQDVQPRPPPITEPVKIGAEAYPDTLRTELRDAGWAKRNIAGAGTALSNAWEGAKQFVGQGNQRRIDENRIIEQEAPVGAIAGNVALTAVPLARAGTAYKTAAAVGAGLGALAPVAGEQTAGNIITGKLGNAALGAGAGVVGQALANKASQYVARRTAEQAALQSKNQPIDDTLRAAMAEGIGVTPSAVNPTIANTAMESIAGKIASAQEQANRNAPIFDAMARRAIGIADDAPLTKEAAQDVRKAAYQAGYEPVATVGTVPTDRAFQARMYSIANRYQGAARSFPGAISDEVSQIAQLFSVPKFDAGDALQATQYLRDKATDAFRKGETGLGKASREIAKAIEDQIERHLSSSVGGAQPLHAVTRPNGQVVYLSGQEMLKGFRDARTLMAKAHTVEDAIVEGGGSINAKKLAARAQAGKPLSGELKVIGDFANNFPRAAQPAAQIAGPGVSKLGYYGGAGIATMAGAALGPIGAAAAGGASLAVPYAMREALLSKPMQRSLLRDYGPTLGMRAASAFRDKAATAAPMTIAELARLREDKETTGRRLSDLISAPR